MNRAAFDELLGVVDEAISVADAAVAEKSAAPAPAPTQETITLVKVARARCFDVADALVKSGAFPDKTREDLARTLEDGGSATHLDLLEKLASRAVFPLDLSGDLGGELVEKSAVSRTEGDGPKTKTDIWMEAWDEAEAECAG